jgi:hypothetical protein
MPVLAIEVEVNGKRLVVAGAKDLSVLTASIGAVGLLGGDTVEFRPTKGEPTDVLLHVLGITSRRSSVNVQLNWGKVPLKVGDAVTLRVVEVEEADPPLETLRTLSPAELEAAADRGSSQRRGLTARSRPTRRKRRAPKRGR